MYCKQFPLLPVIISISLHLAQAATQCGPQETLYYDPETQAPRCCQEGGSMTWQDHEARLGFCCAPGHEWTGDIASGEGGCCEIGMIMVQGMCVHKDSPEAIKIPESKAGGCGCHHSSGSEEPMTSLTSTTQLEDDSNDREPDQNVVDLQIRYGKCYHLTALPSGRKVGSNRENTIYTPGGLFTDIPFRVCRSTRDCSEAGSPDDNVVFSSQSKFFLQDQMGRYNDPSATPGWVSSTSRGVLKMQFTVNANDATGFTGVPNASASECEGEGSCIKLSTVPSALQFTPAECDSSVGDYSGQTRMEDEL